MCVKIFCHYEKKFFSNIYKGYTINNYTKTHPANRPNKKYTKYIYTLHSRTLCEYTQNLYQQQYAQKFHIFVCRIQRSRRYCRWKVLLLYFSGSKVEQDFGFLLFPMPKSSMRQLFCS